MEVEALTVTADEKQRRAGPARPAKARQRTGYPDCAATRLRSGCGSDRGLGSAASRGGCRRCQKPSRQAVVERKRTRNLSEDKRFKLFSGTANRPWPRKSAATSGFRWRGQNAALRRRRSLLPTT